MGICVLKTLASVGLSSKDETVLKSLLDLFGTKTRDHWVYATWDHADAIVLDMDNSEAVAQWRGSDEMKRRIPIALSGEASSLSASYHLPKPLRAAPLISVLNLIVEQGQQSATGQATGLGQESAQDDVDVENSGSLAQRIQSCDARFLKVAFHRGKVLLDRQNRLCAASLSLEQISGLIAELSEDVEITESESAFPDEEADMEWVSDKQLLWLIGISGSEGRLLAGLAPDSRFKLLRWPSPVLIRRSQDFMTLCALMSRKSGVTLEEIVASSDVSRGRAIAFINAASLIGTIAVSTVNVESAQGRASSASGVSKGLLAKIRSRLKV